MMKNTKKIKMLSARKQYLALCISALTTYSGSLFTNSYASDIEIYKQATTGSTTLMLMLDISGSMGSTSAASGYSYSDDYGLTSCGTTSQTALPNNGNGSSSFIDNTAYFVTSGTLPSYSRNFCYVDTANASTRPLVRNNCESVTGGYRCYDRITKLKDGLFDLLQGNSTKGVERLSDDKVIGLSTFPVSDRIAAGQIVVSARALGSPVIDSVTNQNITQRDLLLRRIASLSALGGTPTASSYAEVVSYLMGTNTGALNDVNAFFGALNASGLFDGSYKICRSWNGNLCTSWLPLAANAYYGGFNPTLFTGYRQGEFSAANTTFTPAGFFFVGPKSSIGFPYSSNDLKNNTQYIQPQTILDQKINNANNQCSGQGIYVLTDGAPNSSGNINANQMMNNALSSNTFNCSNSPLTQVNDADGFDKGGAWQCIGNFAQTLLDSTRNPAGLKFKTAVVGFGSGFQMPNDRAYVAVKKNDGTKDEEATITKNVASINAVTNLSADVRNAALWGIYGQGGWYSGSNSQDVVNSVNSFLGELNAEIKPVTTGKVTIANDPINPTKLQSDAYYPQFQPKPNEQFRLWLGNLKKYSIDHIINLDNARDLWASSSVSIEDQKPESLIGGVVDKLTLGFKDSGIANRVLYTNRDITKPSDNYNGDTLTKVLLKDLIDSNNTDADRGYLVSLLGFDVDPTNPQQITDALLKQSAELRQIGAVMHSSPLLITNYAKNVNNQYLDLNRQDYIIFGTTQGLLHIVDKSSGEEKFAFVPNEMVENQKQAFTKPELSTGGASHLFYGVDAPWVADSEYVLAENNAINKAITVGKGLYKQEGRQVIYGGLRMGGKSYYALDLSDIDNPKLKFHINPQGVCSSEKPLGCMGQSWSKPTIAWVNWKGEKKRVMFVGGGYDAEGESPSSSQTDKYKGYEYEDYDQTSKIGAGVYMFDAENGDLLWTASANVDSNSSTYTYHADMKYSVVSQIKTVDHNADGLVDHLYFGDLGGQVWRIDINNSAGKSYPELFSKKPVRILNLNKGAYSPRFYEQPAFSTYSKNGKIFAVVSIGSGNRSKPLAKYSADSNYMNDAIYNIYDKDVVRSDLYKKDDNNKYINQEDGLLTKDVSIRTGSGQATSYLYEITDDNRFSNNVILANYNTTAGWYYQFKNNQIQVEKVMDSPVVMKNGLYVTTFDSLATGSTGQCGSGVSGASFMTLFCMPYGQCGSGSSTAYRLGLGTGIVGGAVGSKNSNGLERNIITMGGGSDGGNVLSGGGKTTAKARVQRWYERYQ